MKRSFIREILENITNETISFAGGLPNEALFPINELKISANKVLNHPSSLQYTTSTGYEPLKDKIAQFYTDEGFETSSENILITSGSQQALDIISRYYNNKDITVEAPSYLGAMNVFDLNNLKQNTISLTKDGIDIKLFNESFKQTKMSYLIPDFQNPTGTTYSHNKRIEIANIIKNQNGIIIEDAPYSQLYFKEKFKSISSLLPHNSFHLGSFSKTLAPSLRLGWIRADKELLKPLIAYKETMDLHSNGLSQYILNDYLDDKNQFLEHLKILREEYNQNMNNFARALDELLPQFIYEKPKGGMFIYGKLLNVDTASLVDKCLKEGVVFVPGCEFYSKGIQHDEIRFNFTHCSIENIYKGLLIIKKIIENL